MKITQAQTGGFEYFLTAKDDLAISSAQCFFFVDIKYGMVVVIPYYIGCSINSERLKPDYASHLASRVALTP
ncbi:hypothetical protein [Microbulbifer sp. VAAF005]|uniref:hypothetical protein n=1 Tax=Microbulbifer sp. VAAF005 TaxID=3034230 RepID=UPI0024ADF165|nr:hypothetical protein [Microbulbifer sp. VAAF005]WHI45747.1 hypothetical protein P0078_18775 [Microbulbifer sp. VAAF005]